MLTALSQGAFLMFLKYFFTKVCSSNHLLRVLYYQCCMILHLTLSYQRLIIDLQLQIYGHFCYGHYAVYWLTVGDYVRYLHSSTFQHLTAEFVRLGLSFLRSKDYYDPKVWVLKALKGSSKSLSPFFWTWKIWCSFLSIKLVYSFNDI